MPAGKFSPKARCGNGRSAGFPQRAGHSELASKADDAVGTAACRQRRFRGATGPCFSIRSQRFVGRVAVRCPVGDLFRLLAHDAAVARKERRSGWFILVVLSSVPLRRKMRPSSPGAEGGSGRWSIPQRVGYSEPALGRAPWVEWRRVGRGGFEGATGLSFSIRSQRFVGRVAVRCPVGDLFRQPALDARWRGRSAAAGGFSM